MKIFERSISSTRAAFLACLVASISTPALAQYQTYNNGWAPGNSPVSFSSNAMAPPAFNSPFPSAQSMLGAQISPGAQMMPSPYAGGDRCPQSAVNSWQRSLPSWPVFANPVQNQNEASTAASLVAYNKGLKQLGLHHYQRAIGDFLTAQNANPFFAPVHASLAEAYYELGDFHNSISEFELALQFAPQDSQSCFFAGMSAVRLRDYNHANAMFNRYLTLSSVGERADKARKIIEILDRNYFHPVSGDYLADVTSTRYERWQTNGKPLTVYVADGSSSKGFRPEYDHVLRKSFQEWANASCGKLAFEFVTSPEAAQITCSWTDRKAKLTNDTELGLTTTRADQNGTIASAHIDLFLFSQDKKTPASELRSQARNVDLHEIGHALGFGHSGFAFDIMAPTLFPLGLEFPLTARDVNTISGLYSAAQPYFADSNKSVNGIAAGASERVPSDFTGASIAEKGAHDQISKAHLGLSRKADLWKFSDQ